MLLLVTRSCYVRLRTADATNKHANLPTDGSLSNVTVTRRIGDVKVNIQALRTQLLFAMSHWIIFKYVVTFQSDLLPPSSRKWARRHGVACQKTTIFTVAKATAPNLTSNINFHHKLLHRAMVHQHAAVHYYVTYTDWIWQCGAVLERHAQLMVCFINLKYVYSQEEINW